MIKKEAHQEAILNCKQQGGFAVLCHPNWQRKEYWPWKDIDALFGYTGIEIYNGLISRLSSPMDGPVERIKSEVRNSIHLLGQGGGYFCAPDQWMPFPDVHMKAFDEALKEFGTYPLLNTSNNA